MSKDKGLGSAPSSSIVTSRYNCLRGLSYQSLAAPSTMLEECSMLAIFRVENNHPPIQGQETHLMIWLQTVIPMDHIDLVKRYDQVNEASFSIVKSLVFTIDMH